MTIESWNLIFSAATTGLVLVGGIWLKYVVAQQLATKDATIQHLQAEITTLKNERAPALAAEHKNMREFADQISADKQKLEAQVKDLNEAGKRQGATPGYVQGRAEGLLQAVTTVLKHLDNLKKVPTATFNGVTVAALQELVEQMKSSTSELLQHRATKV